DAARNLELFRRLHHRGCGHCSFGARRRFARDYEQKTSHSGVEEDTLTDRGRGTLAASAQEAGRSAIVATEALMIAPSPPAGPLRERATQWFNGNRWVRGCNLTPHPSELVERSALPSPAGGEGAITSATLTPASARTSIASRRSALC